MLKNFGKDFVIYGIGIALTKSLGIITLPLLTLYLSPQEIGIIELMTSFSSILVLLILLGVDTGVTFFYWDKKDNKQAQYSYITNASYIILLSSICICVIFYLLEGVITQYFFRQDKLEYYNLLYFYSSTQALFLFMTKLLRTQRKTIKYNTVIFTSSLFFLLFIYIFMDNTADEGLVFYGRSLSNIIIILCLVPFFISVLSPKFEKKQVVDLLTYSVPLIPFAIVSILLSMSDKYFINLYFSAAVVGQYAVIAKISGIISLVIAAFSLVFGPFAMSIKDRIDAKQTYASIYELYTFSCVLLILLIQYFSEPLLMFLASNNDTYQEYLFLIGIIASCTFLASSFGQLGIGLNLLKKNKYFSYGTLFSLILNIILNILFIEEFGVLGVASASLISMLLSCLWIYCISNKYYPIKYNIGFLFCCMFVLLISVYWSVFFQSDIVPFSFPIMLVLGWYKVNSLKKGVLNEKA